MKKLISAISFSILVCSTAQAGPYSDALTRCMVDNTSRSEKMLFVKWIYAGMSKHPEVASMSTISNAQSIRLNQMTADLVTELMVKRCPHESKQGFRYEGEQSFRAAFEMLGKVAMQELMTNPSVNNYMSGIGNYIDENDFKVLE